MHFEYSDKTKGLIEKLRGFMDEHIYPNEERYHREVQEGERWKVLPVIEELKPKAREAGLWNLFLNICDHDTGEWKGPGLTNLEYAPLAEEMGRAGWSSEVFNCSAPDTGNMEVLRTYGTEEQKQTWLKPLMAGEIRSAFLMTEPAVASSDATNIETSIRHNDHQCSVRAWRGHEKPVPAVPTRALHLALQPTACGPKAARRG
jgi:alkylation response protein AidB-like acyl-CoA dehydrogenase